MELTQEQMNEALTMIAECADRALLALTEAQIAGDWYWRWVEWRSVEWNICEFNDALEIYKRRCRRWETYHNGDCCVVERVRDKYLTPRVREFLTRCAASSAVNNFSK